MFVSCVYSASNSYNLAWSKEYCTVHSAMAHILHLAATWQRYNIIKHNPPHEQPPHPPPLRRQHRGEHAMDLGTGRRTVQATAEMPSYSHSLSLTTSTSQQCTTKRSHLLQPLQVHTLKLLGNNASHVPRTRTLRRKACLRILLVNEVGSLPVWQGGDSLYS